MMDNIKKLELLDYTYSDLKLDGSSLTREGVAKIMEGQLIPSVSMEEHEELSCHRKALRIMDDMLHMQADLDRGGLLRIAGAWEGMIGVRLRTGSPVLPHLGFTPPYHDDVPELLDELFRKIWREHSDADTCERAAILHNGIIAVYPFETHSEMLARAAMQYELKKSGLPVTPIDITEQDYNIMTEKAIKSSDPTPFAAIIKQSAEKRIQYLRELRSL
jgi:Fic family protein